MRFGTQHGKRARRRSKMTPESKVKTQVKRILDDNQVYYFMPPGMGLGRGGIPDIIACVNGHFLGIECKAGKGKTTALQDRELAAIRAAGGTAVTINEDSLHTLKVIVDAFR